MFAVEDDVLVVGERRFPWAQQLQPFPPGSEHVRFKLMLENGWNVMVWFYPGFPEVAYFGAFNRYLDEYREASWTKADHPPHVDAEEFLRLLAKVATLPSEPPYGPEVR